MVLEVVWGSGSTIDVKFAEVNWGTMPDVIVAFAALVGLATVCLAWRDFRRREADRLRHYAANVGVSAEKEQGRSTLTVRATNGNPAPIYNCIVTVSFIPLDQYKPDPMKWFPGVLHPGVWEQRLAMDGRAIADLAEIRFTDGNGRRWRRDSTGTLGPSEN